jgi:DNA-binding transcriptional LysR family regulator
LETISVADLQCFLAIAQSGSLTRAGLRLGLQKAAVSKSLSRLEQELGVTLFERNTRRLAITRAGSILRTRAEGVISDMQALRTELRRDEREVAGTLTLAAPPELGVVMTRPVFAAYLAEHPRARLRLRLDYNYQDLFDPEIDVALRVGEVRDDTVVARPIWTFRRVLVASSAMLRDCPLKTPADLSRAPCLGFDEGNFSWRWAVTDGESSRTVDVKGRFVARSYPAALAAACAGVGVAFLPEFVVAPLIEQGALLRVLPRFGSELTTVWLLFRPGHSRVRRVSAFAERLVQARDLPPGLSPL